MVLFVIKFHLSDISNLLAWLVCMSHIHAYTDTSTEHYALALDTPYNHTKHSLVVRWLHTCISIQLNTFSTQSDTFGARRMGRVLQKLGLEVE